MNLPAAPQAATPPPAHGSSIGVLFALRAETGPGVTIDSTVQGSAAQQAGILRGDVIISLNGQNIRDVDDLTTRVSSIPVGSRMALTVDRHGTSFTLTLTTQDRANVFRQSSTANPALTRSLVASGLTPDQIAKSITLTLDLGTQTLEGVEARGTRTTVPVAAGVLGNERAFNIVNETWYSPELQGHRHGKTQRPAYRRHALPSHRHQTRRPRPVPVPGPEGLQRAALTGAQCVRS